LTYFCDRVREEIEFADEHSLSFAVVTMTLPEESSKQKELFAVAQSQAREYDLVYIGTSGLAVLLSETDLRGVNAFFGRFHNQWKHAPGPVTESLCYDRSADFADRVRSLVETQVPSPEPHPEGEAHSV
jgi:hypothetical protein